MTYLTKSSIEAVRRFNRFYTRRIGVLARGFMGTPYTLPEARFLYELGSAGQATATVIGRELSMDLGYASRMVQSLKRRGLVQARRAPEDGRHSHLSLTDKGRKAFAVLDERSRDQVGTMLAGVRKEDRNRLVAAMDDIEVLLVGRSEKKNIVLRRHRPGDMGWVVERHAALYHEQDGWGAQFEALIAEIVRDFLQNFDSKLEHCWIAERNGERVGCVFVVNDKGDARLRLLLVEPSARGTGLGRRLVEECIAFSREKGYKKLVLWTHANLLAARAIYAATGFKKLKKTEVHDTFGPRAVSEFWELKL